MRNRKNGVIFTMGLALALWVGGCGGASKSEQVSAPDILSDKPHTEAVTFRSAALGKEMRLNVYLPPGYESDEERRYPVLYLLHGYTGTVNDWVPGFGTDTLADKMIEEGKIVPLVIVSVQIDNSYGINSGDGRYQDYLAQDVLGYVDDHYRTVTKRDGRYIGGLSMGGFAALYTAFTHPDLFGKVGGHSPAVFTEAFTNATSLKPWLYPDEKTQAERDPLLLARTQDLSGLSVYLDCGNDDYYKFDEGSERLYDILQEVGVPVEYHLNKGKHDGAYWRSQLANYLLFYAGQ